MSFDIMTEKCYYKQDEKHLQNVVYEGNRGIYSIYLNGEKTRRIREVYDYEWTEETL